MKVTDCYGVIGDEDVSGVPCMMPEHYNSKGITATT